MQICYYISALIWYQRHINLELLGAHLLHRIIFNQGLPEVFIFHYFKSFIPVHDKPLIIFFHYAFNHVFDDTPLGLLNSSNVYRKTQRAGVDSGLFGSFYQTILNVFYATEHSSNFVFDINFIIFHNSWP